MRTRRKLAAALVAGGLALGLGACEAEDGGTSPGLEEGGTEDPLAPADDGATDPLAPADDTATEG